MKVMEYVTERADETIDSGTLECKGPFKLRVVLRRDGIALTKARVLVYLEER